jgi:glycosyltransferase involved in cell wall biosynthesis
MVEFSIVITTYNRLSLLRRALDSALAQTLPCEIIVVDDCSSDGTANYLKNLGEKVKTLTNSQNSGQHSEPVNLGVKLAQGNWIKLLDDDDYLAPNCLEIMNEAITQSPSAVICSCQSVQVNQESIEIQRTLPIGSERFVYIPQKTIHYKMLIEQLPFGTPVQVAFRKDAFIVSGGWDVALNVCDDIDSWLRIAQFGDAIFINQCLAYRTIWSGGSNQKFSLQKRLEANILIKEKIYSLVHEEYRSAIPPMSEIRNYLQLYWGLVALRHKIFLSFFKIAFPAILFGRSWQLFFMYKKSSAIEAILINQ